MKDIMFFDANCQLGKPMNSAITYAETTAQLIEKMDYAGVDYALVRHIAMAPGGAVYANIRIAEMLEEDKTERLRGVWCVLPEQCGEIPEPEVFFKQMKMNKIRALTMLPAIHRWIPCRMSLGRLMDAAKERKIPFLVAPGDYQTQWESLYKMIEEFKDNIFIIHTCGLWGAERLLRPLLEYYPNVYFEASDYWRPEGLTDLAEKYGAEHLLYGSGYPKYNHGNTMPMLIHTQLSDAEKRLIAGENLKRIIEGAAL